jgi:large subunit ribosomal protein L28
MSWQCDITGKKPLVGNNVSHSNTKTKRRQYPNLQEKAMPSLLLGKMVTLRLSTTAIRTIDKHGGLDAFMLSNPNTDGFSTNALSVRAQIRSKAAATN